MRWQRQGWRPSTGSTEATEPRRPALKMSACRPRAGSSRYLDDHVGRLDHADCFRPDPEPEFIDRLRGHQADQAVRSTQDLDDSRNAVALDPRDDARELIAGGLGDDWPRGRATAAFGEQPADLG